MSDVAFRTIGLGKMYRIGGERQAYRTLRDTLAQAAKRPIERLRHPGAATHASEELWALKQIDLEVNHGEVLGIIGRNGSGKSTLLKVLSHITEPTEGRAELRGRVASLLEVGTGFHSELTGRENIQLNGAILGMTRAEIKSRFDDIVEFSEIGRFLDTPVKRYSSGMYVRLAFAVAAHLDPEILIVDEVLAVGDAAFQKKCLGKLGDVARSGRTVAFVSHNMGAVTAMCTRAILLDAGRIADAGPTGKVVSQYTASGEEATSSREWSRETAPGDEFARLLKIQISQAGEDVRGVLRSSVPTEVALTMLIERPTRNLQLGFELLDDRGVEVFETYHCDSEDREILPTGVHQLYCSIPAGLLNGGRYVISPVAALHRDRWILREASDAALRFEVTLDHSHSDLWQGPRSGLLALRLAWRSDSVVADPTEPE